MERNSHKSGKARGRFPFLHREKYVKKNILFSKSIEWGTYRESPHYADFETVGSAERGAPHLAHNVMMMPLLSSLIKFIYSEKATKF